MGHVLSGLENGVKDVFTAGKDVFTGNFGNLGQDLMGAVTFKDVAGMREKGKIQRAKIAQAKQFRTQAQKFVSQSKEAQVRAYEMGQRQQRDLQQGLSQRMADSSYSQNMQGGRKKRNRRVLDKKGGRVKKTKYSRLGVKTSRVMKLI